MADDNQPALSIVLGVVWHWSMVVHWMSCCWRGWFSSYWFHFLEIIQLLLWLVEITNPTGDSCLTMGTGVNYKRYWVSEKNERKQDTQQSTERTTACEYFWDNRNIAAIAGRIKCDAGSLDIWIVSKIYIINMFYVENNIVWLLALP